MESSYNSEAALRTREVMDYVLALDRADLLALYDRFGILVTDDLLDAIMDPQDDSQALMSLTMKSMATGFVIAERQYGRASK